jgi:hypothetical protein
MNERIDQEFVNIAILENVVEAQFVESVLKDYGIPHRIRSFHDTAYNGLFQFQLGWGALWAPVSFRAEILEILHDIRLNDFQSKPK